MNVFRCLLLYTVKKLFVLDSLKCSLDKGAEVGARAEVVAEFLGFKGLGVERQGRNGRGRRLVEGADVHEETEIT